jgi:S-disulfanyl-L-cysteine oxidoreductase SoxD
MDTPRHIPAPSIARAIGSCTRSSVCLPTLLIVLAAAACSSGPAPRAGAPDTPSPPAASEPAGTPAPPPGGAAPPGRGSPAVIPATQADRGRDAFLASCTACHASGEFSASSFRRRWSTRNAADLFRLMSNTMPEDAPSSLAPERYLEIVAYILTMNGFDSSPSAGPWDVTTLDGISLAPLAGS